MQNPIYEYLMDIVRNEKVSDFHLHGDSLLPIVVMVKLRKKIISSLAPRA